MRNERIEGSSAPPGTSSELSRAKMQPDAWAGLSCYTSARIALGRAGGSWRTETLLAFRLAHARARDAVVKVFAVDALEAQLRAAGREAVRLATAVSSSSVFLKRPDLGRRLAEDSERWLTEHAGEWADRDLAVIVSDGLSALAAERQAVPTLGALLPLLERAGWRVGPILVVPFARVKLQDEVGALLGVRHSLVLLGERPGLGSPDSLGAYLTYRPGPSKTDADRNCVSNIRPEGLSPAEAGVKLAQLLMESAKRRCSGVALKAPKPMPTAGCRTAPGARVCDPQRLRP